MNALMSFSDGSGPYISYRKMETTQLLRKEMEGKVFLSRQSRHLSFVGNIIKVLFPTLYLDLACKQLCFLPRKGYK